MKKLIALLVLLLPVSAQAVFIDFEAIPDYGTVTNQYPGVLFSAPGSTVEVSDYGAVDWGTAAPKIACPRDDNSYCGGTLVVDFLNPASLLTFLFTGDDFAGIVGTALISDTNGLLSIMTLVGDADPFTSHLVDFSAYSGITRLEVILTDEEYRLEGLGYDDFNFSTVPEPATLALLGLGLAGIGFSRKKKS